MLTLKLIAGRHLSDTGVKRPPPSLGKYQLLYAYLHGRFADRIVLTFNEIEDLLGSSLPVAARRERAWWSGPDTGGAVSEQSDAWTLADRRAEVNIPAQRVVFDRHETLRMRPMNESTQRRVHS